MGPPGGRWHAPGRDSPNGPRASPQETLEAIRQGLTSRAHGGKEAKRECQTTDATVVVHQNLDCCNRSVRNEPSQ